MPKTNKRELPISKNGMIRTYTYYAYALSIMDNDYHTGELAADIDIREYNNFEWENSIEELSLEASGDNLRFYANKYNKNMNACMFRKADIYDEIRLTIHYQQYSQPWSSINIFLAKREDGHKNGDAYICKLGNFCRSGIFYRIQSKDVKIDKFLCEDANEIVLRRDRNEIKALVIDKNGKSHLLHTKNIYGVCEDELVFGMQIKLNDNNYYHWLFSNFIQLDCDIKDPNCKIKYFYGIRKNWNTYNMNHFLDYNEIDWDDVTSDHSKRLDYIKKRIDRGYYVELWMNQYFIETRSEYQSFHLFHQNLIYGYDNVNKRLLLLGFDDNGYLEQTSITYNHFKNDMNFTKKHDKLYLIKYNQDGNLYYFDIDYVKEMVRQYLNGTNSSVYMQFLMQKENRIYGMNIYDEWLKEEWLNQFVSDNRILHLFHEHKVCMKKRIEFIYYNKYIDGRTYEILNTQIDEIILLAESLKYMALKCSMNNRVLNKKDFHEILIELKEKERLCYQKLLEGLA